MTTRPAATHRYTCLSQQTHRRRAPAAARRSALCCLLHSAKTSSCWQQAQWTGQLQVRVLNGRTQPLCVQFVCCRLTRVISSTASPLQTSSSSSQSWTAAGRHCVAKHTHSQPTCEHTGDRERQQCKTLAACVSPAVCAPLCLFAVWDMAAGGRLLHMAGLKGHQKPVRSLAFTPGRLAFITRAAWTGVLAGVWLAFTRAAWTGVVAGVGLSQVARGGRPWR